MEVKMRSREKQLIELLVNEHDYLSAKQLSQSLNYSIRSIKTYVKNINEQYPNAIDSSHKGYLANIAIISQISNTAQRNIPETQEERTALILKALLDVKTSIDLFDICDRFFISESTLRSDLIKAKQIAEQRQLTIQTNSNQICLKGSERQKRMLLNNLINSETADTIFSFDNLTTIYGSENAEIVREIIITTFDEFDYYTNDYLLNNIVLHVLIAMERMRQNALLDSDLSIETNDTISIEIAQKIAERLEKNCNIQYSNREIIDLALLINSSVNTVNFMTTTIDDIEKVIGKKQSILVHRILTEIKENYLIDLNSPNFKICFSLHIKNLLARLENQTSVHNILTKQIKRECPLIYDCAVNVASIIEESTGFFLSDDEIAYLSFNLGNAFEVYKEQKYKINCCLLSPIYYNMNKDILKKLNNLFSDDLSIENVIVHEHDLKNIKPELIISTVPLKRIPAIPNVRINPFIGEKDKQLINKAIRDIKHQREIQLFKTNLENITNPDLFFLQTKQISKETVLKILCNALEKQGFCQSNYLAHIQKREQLSSTAFGKVAIPHSIKMIGQKTGMAILINPNGIQWGNSIVNIVLMLCIQSNDKKLFHEIFNQLSEILTNEHLNQKLATSNDFHEFTEKLLAFL